MTDPLVPAEVDLRGLPFMPLDVNRLRDSNLAIKATGDEFRAAVLLWCASWNQVPAASLPDDDAELAAYAGYGRDVKSWKKVRAGSLRGFVLCSDGRLYHPVVADKAREAWEERVEYWEKRDNEGERLKRHREEHRALRAELREFGIVCRFNEPIERLRELLQEAKQQHDLQRKCNATETRTAPLPATAKTGTGTGTGIKDQELSSLRSDSSPPAAETVPTDLAVKAAQKAERLKQVTDEAVSAFNATLAKPAGRLPAVHLVNDVRQRQVKRCLDTSRAICRRQYGAERITAEFWADYFAAAAEDDFLAGRIAGGPGHENWTPDFEYLTRPDVMTKLFDKTLSAAESS